MAETTTPEVWKNWERQGKPAFMKTCEQIVKSCKSTSPVLAENAGNLELLRSIHDFITRGIKGQIRKEAVVGTIKEIMVLHDDMPSMLTDLINVLDVETTVGEHVEDRQRFCSIIKDTEKIFTEKLMKERLEIDTLQEIGTLKNKSFYTKFIKVKTKLYYKQRKFNLFREESEGFAKLIVDLNQEVSGNVTVKNIHEVIISLIGFFYLDPNRVLDIILESFECSQYNYDFFIPLLRAYMPNPKTLCEVLGFKYRHFQENEVTPESLYLITAYMIQHGIIAIDDIYCWLSPLDKVMIKQFNREMQDAKEYEKKLNVISLSKADAVEEPTEEKDTTSMLQEKYATNQKFGLCEALLNIGDWFHAEQLLQKLPDHLLMEQPPIIRALCKLLHSLIDPVYRKNCRIAPKIVGRAIPAPANPLAPKQAETFDDLCSYILPMLLALGSSLSDDPCLMYKVLRLCKAILSQIDINPQSNYPSNSYFYSVINLLDHVVLPSLSFMECNCCIAEEVWNVLKLLPYQVRYCLYSRWKSETYLANAKLLRKRAEAQKKIKGIMKRVSKENIKPVGRLLGKLSHCSPGFLFDYVLLQIQIYDNLINPVVDSLKYLTSLSYDVLGYCLVESLTSADRDRVKHDGTSISLWLQSLAAFSGAIFKKYNIELTGLLQYVCNQLKAERSLDLLILKEIVQKMAGIEAAEEMTMDQLEAMAGGDILKGEGGYFSQVRNTKKSSQRLKEALAEDNLAVALCLLIAQQRYCVAYKETENSHLKLVGKLYDQCQDTLVQFGSFLASTLTMDEYVTKLPSIHSMLADYHIHTDVAFFLARPMFTHAINLKYDSLRKTDPNWKKLSQVAKHQKYCDAVSEVMSPIVTSVRPLHPLKVWEDISPQFLVTFWSLTMYDLFVPTESYQRETNKMRALALQAVDSKDMSGSSSKGKKEQERYTALVDKLQDEKKKQTEHVEKVMARLKQEKDSWFLSRSAKSAKNETITQFLQLCLFPRCIFTATDALYCAKFVKTIHGLKTANFSTLLCYDRLFCDITYSVTSCTENEANRYGRFLCAMLATVMNWHASKELFDKECANYPGFVTKYRVSNQFSEASDQVGYENYRHVVHKWHYKITKAMVVCLDSKDYVQIRNGLIVLIKILPHFPVLSKLNQIIERKIDKVREEEKNKRQDLFTLATSYSGQLKAKTPMIIKEYDFHQVSEKSTSMQMLKQDQESTSKADSTSNPGPAATNKQVNGEVRQEKEQSRKDNKEISKEIKVEKKASRQSDSKASPIKSTPTTSSSDGKRDASLLSTAKDKSEKEKSKEKDFEPKEKMVKKEGRDETEREKRAKEKKEEKLAQREENRAMREERSQKDDRAYREERGNYNEMLLIKDERYYGSNPSSSHAYHASRADGMPEDRDLSSLSNSSSGSHRHSQEPPEAVRVVKRRKVESGMSSSKSSKAEERRQQMLLLEQMVPSSSTEKEVKEKRSSKNKEKREKLIVMEEDKEQRKERRQSRKRDRCETPLQPTEKRRKSEEKGLKTPNHQNGEPLNEHSLREKHHYIREKSPYVHERSHDREGRDKHRRSGGETKRR